MNYSRDRLSNNYYDALIETRFLENNNKMADVIRGTIQQVPAPREFVGNGGKVTLYYSIKVNDVYYSAGSKKPPEPGTLVEFEAEQKGKYWNVTKAGVRVIPGGSPTGSVGSAAVTASSGKATGGLTKDGYWNAKEQRDLEWQKHQKEVVQPKIELQAARNAAIEFVKLLITPVGVDKDGAAVTALKLGAQNKREAILFEAVQKYTQEFVNSNKSISENKNNNEQDSSPDQAERNEQATDSSDETWVV